MGQYYNCLTKRGDLVKNYNLQIKDCSGDFNFEGKDNPLEPDDHYVNVKLMGHCWWENEFMLSITSKLWRNKMQIAWVGDYASSCCDEGADDDISPKTLCEMSYNIFDESRIEAGYMTLKDKLLVNHTKKIYIDGNEYFSQNRQPDHEWVCIHPLPLLTAVGNGQGGGDYSGTDIEHVGSWRWNMVEVIDNSEKLPSDYKKVEYHFKFIPD